MVCVPVYQLAPMFRKTQVLKSGMIVRGGSSTSNLIEPSLSTSLQGRQQGMQGVVNLFGVVQAHRTSSNLLEPHHYKDSKVCRVLSHEFGVVNNCMAEHCLACSRR